MTDEHFTATLMAAVAGDPDALAVLWHELRRFGSSTAYKRKADLARAGYDADDVDMLAAEALCVAVKTADPTRSQNEFTAYYQRHVMSVVAHELQGKLESMISMTRLDAPVQGSDDDSLRILDTIPDDSPTADPALRVYQDDVTAELGEILNALPEIQRKVVVGSVMEQRSQSAISTELGVSPQRVSQIKRQALKTLRKHTSNLYDNVQSSTSKKSVRAFTASGTSIVEDIADQRQNARRREYQRRRSLQEALKHKHK